MSAQKSVKVSMVNYNKAVRTARTAANKAGQASWIIGDAALNVATEYGENKLKTFADDISVEIGTVRNFRTMAKVFPADDIARDLQSPTVYGIFASQDDAYSLVTDGNNGAKWTVSAARALVKSRNDALNGPADDDSDQSEDSGSEPNEPADALVTADAEVDRLYAELSKAVAKANKVRAARNLPIYAKVPAPALNEPAKSEPAKSKPAASKPAASKPAASKPAASKPAASKPAASKPAARKPAASKPAPATIGRHMTFKGVPAHDAGTRPDVCVTCSAGSKSGSRPTTRKPVRNAA